jgi:hypothetical protein
MPAAVRTLSIIVPAGVTWYPEGFDPPETVEESVTAPEMVVVALAPQRLPGPPDSVPLLPPPPLQEFRTVATARMSADMANNLFMVRSLLPTAQAGTRRTGSTRSGNIDVF